ncbi:MAG: hypothetical protein ACI4PF_01915 [Christensenellales bacterium]
MCFLLKCLFSKNKSSNKSNSIISSKDKIDEFEEIDAFFDDDD